ncbi:MAG: MBL fold metallo-hydrolase, partial [Gemmatimonadota bacterium]|nr:MBL fold metallo-hydrolase [Gemmatimonadota bacterium]
LVAGEAVRVGQGTLDVRHTPGHAPGHIVLVGDGVAVTGDCVFAGSIGRTDLPGGDLATLMRSIRGQILTLPDETVLFSGHGPETTVGHERATNPFLVPHFGGATWV